MNLLTDEQLYGLWSCRFQDHEWCFGTSHAKLPEVIAEAGAHDETCQCWRHVIIRYAVDVLHYVPPSVLPEPGFLQCPGQYSTGVEFETPPCGIREIHGSHACPVQPEQQRSGADVMLEHIQECTPAKALVVVDGSADDIVARMQAEGWTLSERVDRLLGKRIRFLTPPADKFLTPPADKEKSDAEIDSAAG
jgi:hypothetical protein